MKAAIRATLETAALVAFCAVVITAAFLDVVWLFAAGIVVFACFLLVAFWRSSYRLAQMRQRK